MATHSFEKFKDATVHTDGNTYEHCIFEHCDMRYAGGEVPTIDQCSISTDTEWNFNGAALNTMRFFVMLREIGATTVAESMWKAIISFKELPDAPVN